MLKIRMLLLVKCLSLACLMALATTRQVRAYCDQGVGCELEGVCYAPYSCVIYHSSILGCNDQYNWVPGSWCGG